ncbi:SidA/IucD/PvdA family monooxygenase [Gordonia jinhuaensis]|uniref:lysine N(6)-hydroxylase/L-ornithine N(5)-oxygenase family protein n=1 Tax=Gordonia jinhuaensis TaxID=1517702 RepID=UPI00166A22DD|nr:SidA/IucD/PvdA family monooxygenase [Gordonia jinhuaensis]
MSSQESVDVIGIGFGPANLGLAIALEESGACVAGGMRTVFCESKPAFGWHPGMMLPGATMQVAFPKDLATMRNPRSAYSFFNYLHCNGRMADFINHQTFFPSRQEFGDYLAWAAQRVDADVRYGHRVTGVELVDPDNPEQALVHCETATGSTTIGARNVIFAPGLNPRLPEGITASSRIFHNHQILQWLPRVPSAPRGAFAVLGAGQSAAEVAGFLHSEYPTAEVHLIHQKFGMTPADDSPFANRVFDPATVDRWYSASPQVRATMLAYHRGTNYSAVDIDLLEELYRREYQEKVAGRRRLFIHGATTIAEVAEDADGVQLTLRDEMSGEITTLSTDALVCATGFRPHDIRSLLSPEDAARCEYDETGPVTSRDCRLLTDDSVGATVYLNGGMEATHGLSSTLLSTIAVRSGEIAESLHARVTALAS